MTRHFRPFDSPGVSLAGLLLQNLRQWEDARLRLWCHRLPWVLLAAPWVDVDLSAYPREGGPPTPLQLDEVAHWHLVHELVDGGLPQWGATAKWALSKLYPEYRQRWSQEHPCAERVAWLLTQMGTTNVIKENLKENLMTKPEPKPEQTNVIDLASLREMGALVKLQGKDYLTHEGLLRLAHQHGLQSISTEIVSWNSIQREAVVSAVVVGSRGRYSGIGDADPSNVNRSISSACLRMAETRAINRALRLYLGLGMTTAEELPGPGASASSGPARASSWNAEEEKQFVSALNGIGLSLTELVDYLLATEQVHPSELPLKERRRLYQWLRYQGGIEALRQQQAS